MPNCAIATCTNTNRKTKGSNIKYFGFPKNENLAKQWVVACRRKDPINLAYATVCSIHFEERFLQVSLKHRLLNYSPRNTRLLKDDAVPTLNLPGVWHKENFVRTLRIAKRNVPKEESASTISEEVEVRLDDGECIENCECAEPQMNNMLLQNELLPPLQMNTENEVIQLRKRKQELELHNKELLYKIKNQRKLIQQYKDEIANMQICIVLKTDLEKRI